MNVSHLNPQNSCRGNSSQLSVVGYRLKRMFLLGCFSLLNESLLPRTKNRRLITILLYVLLVFSPCAWTEPKMCLIPAGHFTMGSDDDLPNEAPSHKIYLDAYYISKTEVTNVEYHQFWLENGGTGSEHTPISYGGEFGIWPRIAKTKPNHPVIGVSWHSAVAYAAWRGMRLPYRSGMGKSGTRNECQTVAPGGNTFYATHQGNNCPREHMEAIGCPSATRWHLSYRDKSLRHT